MKTPAIRIMLDHLYEVAALQDIELLTNSAYCSVYRTIELCERGEEITLPEKQKCKENLVSLCFVLGVDYAWLVHKALVDVGFYDEK